MNSNELNEIIKMYSTEINPNILIVGNNKECISTIKADIYKDKKDYLNKKYDVVIFFDNSFEDFQTIKNFFSDYCIIIILNIYNIEKFSILLNSKLYKYKSYYIGIIKKNIMLTNHLGVQAYFYDNYINNYSEDITFYKQYLSEWHNVDILEIGIGTGRLAFNLVSMCKCYVGIDYSKSMLNLLNEKLKRSENKNIQYYNANMLSYNLGKKFDIIIYPYRVFPYCNNIFDIKRTLNSSKSHLKNKNSRILINSVDFDEEYIKYWNNRKYTINFIANNISYRMEQCISLEDSKFMKRIIKIYNEFGDLISENMDNLYGISVKELISICKECGFEVYKIWKNYEYMDYLAKIELEDVIDEYIIEIGKK